MTTTQQLSADMSLEGRRLRASEQKLARAIKVVTESGLTDIFKGYGASVVYAGRRYTSHGVSECAVGARAVADDVTRDREMARERHVLRLHELPEMGALSVPLPAVAVVRDYLSNSGYATITVEHVGR